MEGLWCGKVPDGVSQDEPLSKQGKLDAHCRDQQVLAKSNALFT